MPRPSDDNKAMSPVHTPLEHSTLMPNTGSYRQSGKVLEPNKGLIVLDTDDSDLDTERMTILDAKNKMRNAAKSRGHTGKGGQFDQAQKIKDHQHGTNVPVTRAETFHKGNVQYVSAFSGMETENRQFEKEKTMQEIVKLVEETQYYKDRQIMFDDEKEINKLKKEKLRIEIAILEKRLLGRIKQIQY